ncbi:TRAP transporter large permease subunit [Polymorphum gilvum]|uniref:TRAP transporter large permease subunit n=1 Tax=Polymorphum gilvum TaxID=991904 RepID=UPI0011D2178A|nr:TRAP transporter large permease subunit [Polymorphum gilvum]
MAKAGARVSGIIVVSQHVSEKTDIVAKKLGEVAKVGVEGSNPFARSSFRRKAPGPWTPSPRPFRFSCRDPAAGDEAPRYRSGLESVLLMITLELAMMTAPVGMNLFAIKDIPNASLADVVKSASPFVILMLLGLAL